MTLGGYQCRPPDPREPPENTERAALVHPRNTRYARFDDAPLFECDAGESVTEIFRMIEPDVGDDAQLRQDHVCRIPSLYQPGFNNGDIDLALREILERHRGRNLEKRGTVLPDLRFHPVGVLNHLFPGYFFSVDPDPLLEIDEVGGCVEACPVAGGGEDRGDHCRCGSLAVRPCEVD